MIIVKNVARAMALKTSFFKIYVSAGYLLMINAIQGKSDPGKCPLWGFMEVHDFLTMALFPGLLLPGWHLGNQRTRVNAILENPDAEKHGQVLNNSDLPGWRITDIYVFFSLLVSPGSFSTEFHWNLNAIQVKAIQEDPHDGNLRRSTIVSPWWFSLDCFCLDCL